MLYLKKIFSAGWCGEVRDVIYSDNGTVTVVYRLTIRGSDGEVNSLKSLGAVLYFTYLVFYQFLAVYRNLQLLKQIKKKFLLILDIFECVTFWKLQRTLLFVFSFVKLSLKEFEGGKK